MAIPIENPYNLGIPIRHEWQFAGREAELEKIDDCLDQAIGGTCTNIAVVGESGTGKTSLLNIVECHARVRGILPVKVALESEMAQSEMTFFREVYDKIFSEGIKLGMFRGFEPSAQLVRKQLDRAYTGEEGALPFPLRFSKMFAECASTNKVLPVMTTMLKSDFEFIASEAKRANVRAIALLLDDCDCITKALLEKLKSLLTDVDGYFACLAGSDKMLGVWNEVLSPMPKIFFRINLLPFPDERAIRRCIRKPLGKAKYREVEIDPDLYTELHALTGGNPYEIQILSHFMYQRLVKGESKTISLHPSVLETMVEQLELERPHITEERSFQKGVKRLTRDHLELAVDHLQFEGLSSEEQSLCELAFTKLTAEALEQKVQVVLDNRRQLADLNVIETINDTFAIRTGVFGKIYLKYFYEATTRRPRRKPRIIGTMPGSLESLLLVKFISEFSNELLRSDGAEGPRWLPFPQASRESLKALIDRFCRSVWDHDFDTLIKSDLYIPVVAVRASEDRVIGDYLVISAEFNCKGQASAGMLFVREIFETEQDRENIKKQFSSLLDNKLNSAGEYGISLSKVESETLPSAVVMSARRLDGLYDDALTTTLQAGQALLDKDPTTALQFAKEGNELTKKITGKIVAEARGNLGFVEMCSGDFENALEHTEESLSILKEPVRLVNLAYILASTAENTGGKLKAEEAVREAITLISRNPTNTAWLLMVYFPGLPVLITDEPKQKLLEYPVVDSVARCTLAVLLALRGEIKDALRMCDLAELRSGDRAFPLRTKARVLLINGELEAALDMLKQAIEVEPANPWAKIEYDKLNSYMKGETAK